ncbi:MAG: HsmA family protein [Deinococcus sp.]|uniref:HsmA family protein n=1 Tax=Deinococcus sp. TaxID=47478 RepID=UPI0026DBE14E|nr:HsmA family protein [Deinococcus sp.]MDO4246641.1 HsmA family protein [Deinococcus sp.]
MTPMLTIAIVAMTTALISYTIGVWGEKRAGTIEPVHLAAFWFGLICDTAGTEMMRRIAESGGTPGGFGLHAILGALALVLMAIHAVWATVTYLKQNPTTLQTFHRFSLSVWGLWLLPYVGGLILANMK